MNIRISQVYGRIRNFYWTVINVFVVRTVNVCPQCTFLNVCLSLVHINKPLKITRVKQVTFYIGTLRCILERVHGLNNVADKGHKSQEGDVHHS